MKTYIGTKIIKAKPMGLLDAEELLERTVAYKGHTKQDGDADGYLVEYEDGYQAWSPQDVFEKAYRQTEGMTFGLAIEALKKGFKVARAGWNGKGMWLLFVIEEAVTIGMREITPPQGPVWYSLLPWIGMKTADNKFVPWLASQTDVLAEDWVIVE